MLWRSRERRPRPQLPSRGAGHLAHILRLRDLSGDFDSILNFLTQEEQSWIQLVAHGPHRQTRRIASVEAEAMGILRGLLVFVFWLALIVLIPLTLTAYWANEQIYSEDTFVRTVDGLYSDAAVQNAVASLFADQVVEQTSGLNWDAFATAVSATDAQREQLLNLETSIGPFVFAQVVAILDTPEFQDVWIAIMATIHRPLTDLLKGNDNELVQSSNGVISITLAPLYDEVFSELRAIGIDLEQVVTVNPDDLNLTMLEAGELTRVQRYLAWFDTGISYAFAAIGLLAILILLLSRSKARALIVMGLAIVAAMAIEIAGLSLGNRFLADRIGNDEHRAATEAIFSELVSLLLRWSIIILVLGAVVMVFGMIVAQIADNRKRSGYVR
jgi:hypothetical protein